MPIGPFEQAIPTNSLRTVAEVVPRLEIRDIRLVNLSCALTAPPPPAGQLKIDLSHTVKVDVVEDTVLAVQVHYLLKASPDGTDSSPFMNMSVVFQLLYDGEEITSIAPEKRQMFGDINAVHNAWPYFREVVQNMAMRMGLQPLTVPLLKIQATPPTDKPAVGPPAKSA
jgi:preprotein translocase subunit SecB